MSKYDDQAELAKGKMQVGELAPDFTLLNQAGVPVSLGDFLGTKHLVLYFYPKDNTSLCTEEACAFRDSYEVFQGSGAEVIWVSSDSVEAIRQRAPTPFHPVERRGRRNQKALWRAHSFRATGARDVHHRQTVHCASHLLLAIHL
jgi:AhpC/TSA family